MLDEAILVVSDGVIIKVENGIKMTLQMTLNTAGVMQEYNEFERQRINSFSRVSKSDVS
ncbi:hypothetical protein ACODM8_19655 [Vibrio ostreicida]|uniref:Uncharacterized protein n=1 Tax=Vibrio ostreicida TaxID=526588 RepID=A0ABT8BZ05_9VIBR|nr:hypothetical protein [Vibrio ostreicida]MDN3611320.1 hypothetical protein [Vibrio ostreicida]NPD09261.1 hypothetical protein [Vibrio ostreicida]